MTDPLFCPAGLPCTDKDGLPLWLFLLGLLPSSNPFTPGSTIDLDSNGTNDGTLLDTNGDGKSDGIDVNGDGISDIILIDSNGDGTPDGIDLNGDGIIDYNIVIGPGGKITITDPVTGNPVTLIDSNGDGIPDGIDKDGDGIIDTVITLGTAAPGTGSTSSSSVCIFNSTSSFNSGCVFN